MRGLWNLSNKYRSPGHSLSTRLRVRPCLEELEGRLVLSTALSTNWSGYASLQTPGSGAVTAVKGSWTVPTVTGSGTSYAAFWVGMDGYSSNSVEQIGTDSDLDGGVPTYYAWYEMYPAAPVYLSMTVDPGDSIAASVGYSAATATSAAAFTLTITDTPSTESGRTAETYTKIITNNASNYARSSAEWIAEAPSSNRGVLPLADFGTVTFSGASATINGVTGPIDGFPDSEITMVTNSGAVKAAPSVLTDSGGTSAFAVNSSGSSGRGGGGFGRSPILLLTTSPLNVMTGPALVQASATGAPSTLNLSTAPVNTVVTLAPVSLSHATVDFGMSRLGEGLPDDAPRNDKPPQDNSVPDQQPQVMQDPGSVVEP